MIVGVKFMQETINSFDLTKILEDSFRDYFWPNFWTVVLPFIVTFFVFLIIRAIFSTLLQRHHVLKQVVDSLIVLICLGFIGFFVAPWVISAIQNIKLPHASIESSYNSKSSFESSKVESWEGYNPFVNPYSDEESYSSENSLESPEVEDSQSYNPFVNPYSEK